MRSAAGRLRHRIAHRSCAGAQECVVKKDPALPPRVFQHGRWYRLAVAKGSKREWHRLSPVAEGLPALWRAYRAFNDGPGAYLMPALIADWEDAELARKSAKTKYDTGYMLRHVAHAFAEFTPEEPTPPICMEFLSEWSGKPRSFNKYRALLRELFRFAIERGKRTGSNPVDGIIRTQAEKPRQRCPSTSEIRRVKIGCLYADDGRRTPSGMTMCVVIELCYLTGQDIGRIVEIRETPGNINEPFLTPEGISFRRSKTGGRVLIEWTPRLKAAVAAAKRIKGKADHPYLLTKQDSTPLNYEAVANAWQRGIKRSGVKHFMLRDIRARALTDKDARDGRRAANIMGTHTTEGQTAEYIRQHMPGRTRATA
jgi:site-specific recombinase XerD